MTLGSIRALIMGAAVLLASSFPSLAQNRSGAFDFYVLSLSWSPSYCATGEGDRAQCGTDRNFSFVVHGLWPQRARDWPQNCNGERWVPQDLVGSMLDLMPSPRLVIQQWRKHGTCSGLDMRRYFETVRAARAKVIVPERFRQPTSYIVTSAREVEAGFLASNPGLAPNMIGVTCASRRLQEVRICLDRSLSFTPCPEIDRRACRATQITMPPVRAGHAASDRF